MLHMELERTDKVEGDMSMLHVETERTDKCEGEDGLAASQGRSCAVEELGLQ